MSIVPEELPPSNELGPKDLMNHMVRQVMAQKEEILIAFIAKYGCDPDEAEQIIEYGPDFISFSIRKKTRG